MKNKKNKEIEFEYIYSEWEISFNCKCGKRIGMNDNDYQPIRCPKCKRDYNFSRGKVKEIKK